MQIALVVLTGALVLLSARIVPLWNRLRGTSGRTMFYYYGLCTASAAWSIMPQFSLYRGVEFLILSSGMFVALFCCRDFRQAERVMLVIGPVVAVMSMTVNLRLGGMPPTISSLHTNSYTIPALMVFCYCVGEYFAADPERRKLLKRAGIAGFALLFAGTSAASNVSAVIGIAIIALVLRKKWLAGLSGALLLLGVLLVAILQPDPGAIMALLFPGKDEKDIMTMTGRTHMWARLWEYYLQSPLIGGGFSVLSSSRGALYAANPHNSILAALVGTGLVGLTLALIYIVKLLRELFAAARNSVPGSVGLAAAIPAALVNSLSKPMILSEFEDSSMVYVGFSALFLLWVHGRQRPPAIVRHGPTVKPNIIQ
jgi:O-antigen ligase